ncbi:MAG: TrmH family RNA methyltransferase [Bacteroidota bacterium]
MPLVKSRIKELRELTHKKYRDEQKKFIAEGVRLVQEAVDSDFKVLEAYYTPDIMEQPGGKALLSRLKDKTTQLFETTAREMELISETVSFQGVLAVLKQKQFSPETMLHKNGTQSILVGLDGVSDPGNLGTIVRTCDWFGVSGILVGRNSVELYNPKVIRSTMGGVFHLPIATGVDLLGMTSEAKALGYKVYVTDLQAETHFDHVQFENKSLIIFGNEAWGVSDQVRELADVRLSIRRYGAAESLNVSVACGVVLSRLHLLFT